MFEAKNLVRKSVFHRREDEGDGRNKQEDNISILETSLEEELQSLPYHGKENR